MMIKKLVSILTPCYNGENFVFRLLDSILAQTYPHIEMFVIDDGSTDNSAEIIKSYIPKFELRGYSLTYVYQENSGQSVAINRGLKLFQGEYLVWPDSDDFYATTDAIEQMANALKNSDDSVSMVRCESLLLNEDTLNIVGKHKVNIKNKNKLDLFEDCLLGTNDFWYGAGNYMGKSSFLLELIPDRNIYTEKRAGQNLQLMLPLLYKNKCLTIESFLYNILVRRNSHSRTQVATYEMVNERYATYERTIQNVLCKMENMPDEERLTWLERVNINYKAIRISTNFHAKRYKAARCIYRELERDEHTLYLTKDMKIQYYLSFLPFSNILFAIWKKTSYYFQ